LRAAATTGLELEFPVLLWMLGEDEPDLAPVTVTDPSLAAPVLTISVRQSEGAIKLRALIRSGGLTTTEVERLFARWAVLLRAIVLDPSVPVAKAPILPDSERRTIVEQWNDTATDWPLDRCVHTLVEEQVARSPERTAVIAEEGRLTYAELDARAEAVAHALRRRGVRPETLVAICAERSLELVVGLLGILKAGGAYVPLDPDYPADRHAYVLSDSEAPVLLTQRRLVDSLPAFSGEILALEDIQVESGDPGDRTRAEVSPENLVYVVYTSGSTGRPKGVMNIHRGVVNRLLDMQRTIPLFGDDRVLQKTPCGFDISVYEFFWPLLTGATLVMARPGGHRDPAYLREVIRAQGITTIHFVPPMRRDPSAGGRPALPLSAERGALQPLWPHGGGDRGDGAPLRSKQGYLDGPDR
jgi:non-ribosomal peptide synthetase component F